ncbi:MAG TPA: response regulator transcription factor [Candidatus Acidoferrum sp.]|jgi:DNA-binding NarL/FixJ family response regulator|nr:response regulator transcription factor [Candidatus Acidoferrum sp.]
MNAAKKKILVVDDHPLVREWLANLIQQQPDLSVSSETESAPSALSAVDTAKPDLVIVDINLKNSSGIELIKSLKESHPEVPVLVLSMHDESLYAERVFRAGARGYVNKRETAQKVVEAIRRVLAGKLYVSEKAAEILAGKTARGQTVNRSAIELLSDRELQVFDKLGQGIGTKQIALDFHVSIKTVQEYCARIKEKLNLTSATELLREAVRWHDSQDESKA